jgi:hypothetical protein
VVGDARLSDKEGWQLVGAMKQDGRDQIREWVAFRESALLGRALPTICHTDYLSRKRWKKLSTKAQHVVNDFLVPRWGDKVAVNIEPPKIKARLKSLVAENGTRYKYKTVMGTLYTFA